MQNAQMSQRTQRILKHLEDNWEALPLLSGDALKSTILTALQTPQCEIIVLRKLAEYMVSTMNLHLLNLITIFRENSDQEGISADDFEETMNGVLPEITRLMGEISNRLSIRSLDDLATLVNITTNLQILSETDSANDAQNWLYELPILYHGRLQQERLLGDVARHIKTYPGTTRPQPVDWSPSYTQKSDKPLVAHEAPYVQPLMKSAYPPIAIRA